MISGVRSQWLRVRSSQSSGSTSGSSPKGQIGPVDSLGASCEGVLPVQVPAPSVAQSSVSDRGGVALGRTTGALGGEQRPLGDRFQRRRRWGWLAAAGAVPVGVVVGGERLLERRHRDLRRLRVGRGPGLVLGRVRQCREELGRLRLRLCLVSTGRPRGRSRRRTWIRLGLLGRGDGGTEHRDGHRGVLDRLPVVLLLLWSVFWSVVRVIEHQRRQRRLAGGDHAGVGGGQLADVLGQHRGQLVRRPAGDGAREHTVADRVQRPGYAGAHLAWPQRAAAVARSSRYGGGGRTGPPPDEPGVQQPDQVEQVGGDVVGLRVVAVAQVVAAQPGVDREPDQPDRAGLGDHDVLGHQPPVGDALPVGHGDRGGDFAHQPGGSVGRQHPTAGDHLVEGVARAPLVDHPRHAVAEVGVEDPQQVRVGDRRRDPRTLEHRVDARVALVEGVHRDAARQHRVGRPPEARAVDVVEQVVEAVATAEHGARDHRAGHGPPSRRGHGR